MIEQYYSDVHMSAEGVYVAICDKCKDEITADTYNNLIRLIKNKGWKCRNVGVGKFLNLCPNCLKKRKGKGKYDFKNNC